MSRVFVSVELGWSRTGQLERTSSASAVHSCFMPSTFLIAFLLAMRKQSAVLLNPASTWAKICVDVPARGGKHSGRGPESVQSHVGRGPKPSST